MGVLIHMKPQVVGGDAQKQTISARIISWLLLFGGLDYEGDAGQIALRLVLRTAAGKWARPQEPLVEDLQQDVVPSGVVLERRTYKVVQLRGHVALNRHEANGLTPSDEGAGATLRAIAERATSRLRERGVA